MEAPKAKNSNGYKVPGQKMTSRFGLSNKGKKLEQKAESIYWASVRREPGSSKHHAPLRVLKTCQHKKWVDTSWGGPESGGMSGHCKICGYSFRHTMY